ncbi:MAG: adenylyl-sulfate kinase [Planctomycetota bacterium]
MSTHQNNLTFHAGGVTAADRAACVGGGQGATVWLTGLSGSGKSTVAVALEKALLDHGRAAYRLDGDNVRLGLNAGLGFSAEDRAENVRRVGEVAKLMADAGLVAIACLVSPYAADRDRVRQSHDASDLAFLEVFVDAPLAVAESRDPKGLYKKARAGEIPSFTGVSDPYEPPASAELVLKTDEMTLDEEVAAILGLLKARGVLPEPSMETTG